MNNNYYNNIRFVKGSTISMLIVALVAVFVLSFFYFKGLKETENIEKDFQNKIAGFVNPFFRSENKILGKSALVLDIKSGIVIYAKNPNIQLPIASITKIMSALVAGQYLQDQNIESITIDNVKVFAVSDMNFILGEKWTLSDLLTAMLISSSNVAAESLSNEVLESQKISNDNFEPMSLVEMMNEVVRIFGLENTKFLNSTGLDINDSDSGNIKFGGVSSSFDVAFMTNMFESIFPEISQQTIQKEIILYSKDGIAHKFENTNPLISNIPIYFSKTGYTDNAGGSVVIKTNIDDRYIYIIVLGSTKEGRFSDVEKLFENTDLFFSDIKNRGVKLEDLYKRNLIGYGY